MRQTHSLPVKKWVFKSRFSFRIRQHGQLFLQYKVCWVLYKIVGFSLFSLPLLCIQPSLRSPPKTCSSTLVSFYFPISPSFVHKIIIAIPTNTPFLYTSATLHPSNFCVQPSQQSAPKTFSLPQPFSQFRLHQGTRELVSLVRTEADLISPLLVVDSDNRAHNPWFPIAQVQKIGVLQVVISDELLAIGIANHPIHLLSYPRPVIMSSIPY